MVELLRYSEDYRSEMLSRIIEFFGFHRSLSGVATAVCDEHTDAVETLFRWLDEKHALYTIRYNNAVAGFLHIGYRGGNVAWIEDIFVDEQLRGNGIASAAIALAEGLVRHQDGYTALCIDVVPRNTNALRLYHRLGYDTLGILTLRKNFTDSKSAAKQRFLVCAFRTDAHRTAQNAPRRFPGRARFTS